MGDKMGKIIYLGHFSSEENPRSVSPAGQTVMNYVCHSIKNAGYYVTMYSFAQATDKMPHQKTEQVLDDNIKAIFGTCFKQYRKNILMRIFTKIKREKTFFKELNEIIEDGDIVISYHSLATMDLLKKLRKKKKFKFILQVCEIYADVLENQKIRKKEIEFIKSADKYILISNLLQKEIMLENKECIVCSGTYTAENVINEPSKDGKIHVVYAGTLDMTKGGAYFAVSAAKYLNKNYHMHILGFGSEQQKNQLLKLIEDTKKDTNCSITYDGCLQGEEYVRFLQICHIGLSTQNPSGAYNATSFPSKILVYLSNGLQVVSIKIPAIETSPVGHAMYFYENSTPKEIAQAVLTVDTTKKYDSRKLIDELNVEFIENLNRLLKE